MLGKGTLTIGRQLKVQKLNTVTLHLSLNEGC